MAVVVNLFTLAVLTCYSYILADITCSTIMCPYPTVCRDSTCVCRNGYNAENCTQNSDMCYCSTGETCSAGNCSCGTGGEFSCTMLPECSADTNITCKHSGTCVIGNNEPYCICPKTANDTLDCTPNRCDNNPCPIGKCLTKPNNDYDCVCPEGGVGKDCDLNKKCSSNFCANGGTCYEYEHARCRCMPGYTGIRCEENTTSTVCDKFGTKVAKTDPTTNKTQCICQTDFKGTTCNMVDCEKKNPCENNALCYSDPSAAAKFICVCPFGWTGDYCNKDINECMNNLCTNNGTCINLNGTYECQCPENATSMNCDDYLSGCLSPETCKKLANNGICDAQCNSIYCDFDGIDCILDDSDPWDECYEEPGYCRSLAGNDKCNQECNREDCLYDLLDCYKKFTEICPQNCTYAWDDGICQPECYTKSCGFDSLDCGLLTDHQVLGTIVVTYIAHSPNASKTIGGVLSSYSGAIFSLEARTEAIKKTSPFELSANPKAFKYTAFFAVYNKVNCTDDSMCWNNTDILSRFSAVFYTKNRMLFQYDKAPVTIKNVRACMIGYYGESCDLTCPVHCNNSKRCDLENGYCLNGCMKGYWGNHCEHTCNENCQLGCERSDGNCTGAACKVGYEGERCQRKCPDGTYGLNCMNNCSMNCQKYTCSNVNGRCTCVPGHKGDNCLKDCTNGTYGENCKEKCGFCVNGEPCEKMYGSCTNGCKPGYLAPMCTGCEKGKYGTDCTKICSSNCQKDYCDSDTGKCIDGKCKPGFKGETCMEALPASKLQDTSNSSTIIAVIIVLIILILVALGLAVVLWMRSKKEGGSYLLDEKGEEMTAMKDIKDGQNKTQSDSSSEPLVAATPTDKNFTDAKLVIESEGIENEEEKMLKAEEARSSKSSDYRSSRSSDFRPDSIHGNGPGGVYVGDYIKQQSKANTDSNHSTESSKTQETSGSIVNPAENDGKEEEADELSNGETNSQENDSENNDDTPITIVANNGVINTDNL